ncbi:aldo/keto reductase [Parvularcula sp. LCG005]|uniref:aldo/keto reductase n=1 Tax=Parvularcula sp. LCG005 TaxID=3078805 RepID=UPI0029426DC4|nr:aldo/keto reductase [Parvularcula sp. LCG005]WOI53456.1 aldo/keto reductase [Parvularcula sp. LCG005]
MRLIELGHTGKTVGQLGYGLWRFSGTGVDEALPKIRTAIDAGMTLIDTADVYGAGDVGFGGSEALLGEVLRADPGLRSKMLLATKGGVDLGVPYDNSRDYMLKACDASLKRLGVEQIDLYQVHRVDLLTGPEELANTLDTLVASGKVAEIGVSNMTAPQLRALSSHMKAPIVSVQNEFSALCQAPIDDGVLSWCQETGATFLCWSPLGGGRLLNPSDNDNAALSVVSALDAIAKTYDMSRADAAMAFLLRYPAKIIPIVGTQTLERIDHFGQKEWPVLGRREWYDVVEAARGERMP